MLRQQCPVLLPAHPPCLHRLLTLACSNVANTAIMNSAPPKTAAQLQKEALAAAAKNLKSQILARSASSGSAASLAAGSGRLASAASSGRVSAAGSTSGKKEVKTLDEYLAGGRGRQAAYVVGLLRVVFGWQEVLHSNAPAWDQRLFLTSRHSSTPLQSGRARRWTAAAAWRAPLRRRPAHGARAAPAQHPAWRLQRWPRQQQR